MIKCINSIDMMKREEENLKNAKLTNLFVEIPKNRTLEIEIEWDIIRSYT